ncbi:MAG: oligosaccharide flippase family protein [Muribaculaceae bacterium]|nr:oligosaccharide flippase family protein [Muribaculaceae bacterium]
MNEIGKTESKHSIDKENTYRSILKGISIFGGVKIFEIFINLIRGKFVALFLGPGGMGYSSIFSNVATTISNLSSFGLNLAIVKEVAVANETKEKLPEVIAVATKLFYATALTGALICIFFSSFISELSFGSQESNWQFFLLGIAVFLLVVNAGKLSLLQGLHEVNRLSRASLTGSVAGLVFGIPLYYFLGNQGIVPAIVMLALTLNIFYSINLKRATKELPQKSFSWSAHRGIVKKLFSLGIILMASDMIGNVCNYVLLIIIRKIGDIDDVGFFQAANSITNQMAGVVFTAMALDYFPRLSRSASDMDKMFGIINRQSEIIALIIFPVSLLIIIIAPLITRILLTSKFEVIIPLLRWMALGVALKAMAYPVSYITFAKDNKKLFFWLEGIIGNLLFVAVPLLFFYNFGLIGFGYGMVIEQTLCLLIYWIVNRRIYGYLPTTRILTIFSLVLLLLSIVLALSYSSGNLFIMVTMIVIAFISTLFCALRLKKMIKTE